MSQVIYSARTKKINISLCMACLEAIPQKVSRRILEKSRVDNQSIDLSLQNIPNITKYHR